MFLVPRSWSLPGDIYRSWIEFHFGAATAVSRLTNFPRRIRLCLGLSKVPITAALGACAVDGYRNVVHLYRRRSVLSSS